MTGFGTVGVVPAVAITTLDWFASVITVGDENMRGDDWKFLLFAVAFFGDSENGTPRDGVDASSKALPEPWVLGRPPDAGNCSNMFPTTDEITCSAICRQSSTMPLWCRSRSLRSAARSSDNECMSTRNFSSTRFRHVGNPWHIVSSAATRSETPCENSDTSKCDRNFDISST